MQTLQTDFGLPQELPAFYASPPWHAAARVLDLGCGNGYYLQQLAARFPDKTYRGFDLSRELTAHSDEHATAGNVTFAQANLFDVSEACDFVVLRLVLQHLDDIEAVLRHVATLVRPEGSVMIIDADDEARSFHPLLPEFTRFFTAYAERERQCGRDRDVCGRVERVLRSSVPWRMGASWRVLIPSTIPGNLERFNRNYSLLVDLVEEVGEVAYDFPDVRRAWREWSQRSDAYTQVGLHLLRLDRT